MIYVILTIASLVLLVVSIILCNVIWDGELWVIGAIVGGFCILIFGGMIISQALDERGMIIQHQEISAYFNGYEFKNEMEEALINQKKVDFNQELSSKKASAKAYPICWLNPTAIIDLDYIY